MTQVQPGEFGTFLVVGDARALLSARRALKRRIDMKVEDSEDGESLVITPTTDNGRKSLSALLVPSRVTIKELQEET